MNQLDTLCINTLRFLAVDAVEAAKSGHPGMPLGAAPMCYTIWDRFLQHNPENPAWFNRDRFVLSAGHGSALLYALLHMNGYDLPLSEIKQFRQWGSKTPGHPEKDIPGVETTTGPLGQGFANGIGMAVAERFLATLFNRENYPIIDHYTYAIVSDGDLMEGVSSEAASLAGMWKLDKIIYLYDDNHITIEGDTNLAFTEDVEKRFESYGWHIQRVSDGNDVSEIEEAIRCAKEEKEKPSLIMIRTHIGFGSPKQDSASSHGEPLGPEATKQTKEALEWPVEPNFFIPDEALSHFRQSIERGRQAEEEWNRQKERYSKENPKLTKQLDHVINGTLPPGWDKEIPEFRTDEGDIATRSASGKVLNAVARKLDNLLGGSADLAPSNKTSLSGKSEFGLNNNWGPNVHFGVREHAMGSIANGIALHGGIFPYVGTFLVFADYMRPALRLAAMSHARTIFVFTHDSVGVGEDGPTHQPVEHIMSLRLIPNLTVIRPADANETAEAWRFAIKHDGPVALALTRQNLPILDRQYYPIVEGVPRGAYILSKEKGEELDIVLIATGSEVHLILNAQNELWEHGIEARVVSMPSWELFEKQSPGYQRAVLPPDVPRLVIEAGCSHGWHKYAGEAGDIVGLDRFGASAPGNTVMENFGFSVKSVVKRTLTLINHRVDHGSNPC